VSLPVFYVAAAVAILATLMVITRSNAVHALLYLVVSLLSVAVVFYDLGAPFVAALEVITYAGAIMVLFVFVIMMLNLGRRAVLLERSWLRARVWIGPVALAAVLLAELAYLLGRGGPGPAAASVVGPREVGIALYGPYLLGVELASILLMGALVGAYHLGWWERPGTESEDDTDATGAAAGRGPVRAGAGRPAGAP
jgi:NADH-quinone oxidoreductase subunit J